MASPPAAEPLSAVASMPETAALRVGLLEDDALLRDRILLPRLRQYGFDVEPLGSAAELFERLPEQGYDMLVLDVGLPDQDGFSVARQMHARFPQMGIVMLTGRQGTPDKVRGLCEGADAYLAKPVEIDLLVATLHSLARRLQGAAASTESRREASWQMDAHGWCLLTPNGASVGLTVSERRVLARLQQQPHAIVTRDALIGVLTDNVYDYDPHRLESLIYRLRRKVQAISGEELPLIAVHGEGYVLRSG